MVDRYFDGDVDVSMVWLKLSELLLVHSVQLLVVGSIVFQRNHHMILVAKLDSGGLDPVLVAASHDGAAGVSS